MVTLRVRLALLAGAAATIGFLWLTDIPLGVPEEWTWSRIQVEPVQRIDCLLGCGLAVAVAAAYVCLAWMGAQRLVGCSRIETAIWLTGLVLAGFAWLWLVRDGRPEKHRYPQPTWVLHDPSSSGYFFEASYKIDDVGTFLAGYEEKMAEGDVMHIGTHPPGLFLIHTGLITACRAWPDFSRLVLETQPEAYREAFRIIERNALLTPNLLPEADRAALWLAALLTHFICALTVVPLYWLLRRDHSPSTCWLAITFWPLIPALAVFLPKSDALFPFLGTLLLCVWLYGWRRQSALLCLIAGLLAWLGMFFSLALLPVVVLAALLTVWEAQSGRNETKPNLVARRLIVATTWACAGFLVPVILLWVVGDLNLWSVWSWNFHNHSAFYDQAQRTRWKWLLVNPLEFALSCGLPIVVLVLANYNKAARIPNAFRQQSLGPFWACAIVWGLLWLSGKNMGEAARLWLFLIPWMLWLAAGCFDEDSPRNSASRQPARLSHWLLAILLQAIVCFATVTRVNGFSFADL